MRWLILKDLQILKRSPLLVALLIVYPLVISVLIGVALSRGPEKPTIAVFSPDAKKNQKLNLGSDTVDTAAYRKEFFASINAFNVTSRQAAVDAVKDGKAIAAMVIPPDIAAKLSTGVEQPTIEVLFNAQDPIKAQFVEDTIRSKLAQANQALSEKLTEIASEYLKLIVTGGEFDVFGTNVQVLGLKRAAAIVRAEASKLPKGSEQRAELLGVARFAQLAIDNLDLSDRALATVGQPIKIQQTSVAGRRTPLNTFAVAVAAAISMMFIAVLLSAGMLALEREEHAFSRLVRGLVSRGRLVTAKIVLATICALPVTFLLLIGIGFFVDLDWSRIPLWLLALAVGAFACASMGVAIGALAREVRAASLMSFLLTLPIAFLALVPSGAVSSALFDVVRVISAVFPFKASLDALSTALNGGGVELWKSLVHLLVIALGFGVIGRIAIRRFA